MERRRRGTGNFKSAAPSALNIHPLSDPGLTAGPTNCRPFGPQKPLFQDTPKLVVLPTKAFVSGIVCDALDNCVISGANLKFAACSVCSQRFE